jgi:hypothetical protein
METFIKAHRRIETMNDKSGLEQLLEWSQKYDCSHYRVMPFVEKASSLLADEKAQEKRPCKDCIGYKQALDTHEPLAEMADRKGYWKTRFCRSCDAMAKKYWICEIEKTSFDIDIDMQRTFDFVDDTYSKMESKVRQYLEGLPDKREIK